jgi:hypothetical protein
MGYQKLRSDLSPDRPLTLGEIKELLRSPGSFMTAKVARRKFPRLPHSTQLTDANLSTRVRNCLYQCGVVELIDLCKFTIGDLFQIQNFGSKSLVNLLSSIEPLLLDDPSDRSGNSGSVLSEAVTRAATNLGEHPCCPRILWTDPRFRTEAEMLFAIANFSSNGRRLRDSASLRAVCYKLAGRASEKVPPKLTLDLVRRVRRKIARAQRITVECEIDEIARAFLTGHRLRIVLSFLDWRGGGVKTLQYVGDEFCVTRERVRQITSEFAEQLQRTRPYVPVLQRAVSHVENSAPRSLKHVDATLSHSGLTQASFGVERIMKAAKIFGVQIRFSIRTLHGIRMVVRYEN